MRMVLISTSLPPEARGGAEAYVAELAQSLRDRHEILLLSGAPGSDVDGVEHVSLPRLRPVRDGDSAAYKVIWHARDQWMPSVHRAIGRELRRFRPDVVHTHEPQGLSAAVFTATARAGVPHVHTAHDLNLLCLRTSMTRHGAFCGGACKDCLVQRLIRGGAVRRHLHRLIAVSEYMRRRHVDAGIVPVERATTIRLAATAGSARVRRFERGLLRLGFIGTLARHKGILTLLETLRHAPTGWSLTIAGSGPLEHRVRSAVGEDQRIRYVGHVGGPSKDAFFEGIDLLVIPSEWEEPSTLVGFEAAVRGIPAIASNLGGLPELPEITLFEARRPDALRRAVERFTCSPARLEELSGRLLRVRRHFLWPTHARRVEQVLEETAHEPR